MYLVHVHCYFQSQEYFLLTKLIFYKFNNFLSISHFSLETNGQA